MNLKNSTALVGNALNHLELFLRQKSKRKIAASRPPKNASAQDGFMPLPQIPPQRTLMVIGQATEPSVTRSMSDYTKAMGLPGGYSFYLILSGDIRRIKRELATIQAFLDRYPGTALFLPWATVRALLVTSGSPCCFLKGASIPRLIICVDG